MTEDEKRIQIVKKTIQKILVNMNEQSHIDKMKFATLLKEYAFLILKKEYVIKGKMPEVHFIPLSEDIFGYFDVGDHNLKISMDAFKKYDNIIESMDSIFHEMRHFAQYTSKRKDKDNINVTGGENIYPDFVYALTLTSVKSLLNAKHNLKMQKRMNDDELEVYFNKEYNKYNYYINHKYYVSDEEMDARQFAINLLYELIFDIDKNKLSATELNNLNNLIDMVGKKFAEEETNILFCESNFSISKEDMDKEIKHMQNEILKCYPEIFEDIATRGEEIMVSSLENYYDVSLALTQSLNFCYDDKLANKLVDSYLIAINNEEMFADTLHYISRISDLCKYTNFRLKEEDAKKLFGQEYSLYLKTINNGKDMRCQSKNNCDDFERQ